MPMPTTATATVLVATTVATGLTVSDTAMDSTTARGRLSPRLMPTTDTDTALAATTVATGPTVSGTGPTEDTEDTASDTAVATSTVRFCLDVLDLDATMLPTFCPWIGPTRI